MAQYQTNAEFVQSRMKALRDRFLERMPELVHKIEQVVDQRALPFESPEALDELRRLARSLGQTAAFVEVAPVADSTDAMLRLLDELEENLARRWETWLRLEEELLRLQGLSTGAADGYPARRRVGWSRPEADAPFCPRLLLVDATAIAPDRLERLARAAGVALTQVSSREEAARAARLEPFDGAIVASSLAGPGFAFARRLESAAPQPLPIAFASVAPGPRARREALEARGLRLLSLPLVAEEVADAARAMRAAVRSQTPVLLAIGSGPAIGLLGGGRPELGFEVRVSERRDLVETLADVDPDVLLLDLDALGPDGFEAIRRVRASRPRLVCLAASERAHPGMRSACLEAGADDFVSKPLLDEEVASRARARLDAAERRHASDRDGATQLLTRPAFVRELRARLRSARWRRTPITLALIDVDALETIEERRGVDCADRVTAGLAEALATCARPTDLAGRWSGGRFALMLDAVDRDTAAAWLGAQLRELADSRFLNEAGETVSATYSAGIATIPDDATSVDGAIRRARARLNRARADGRGRLVCAD